jgi:hypothetical protein
VLVRFSSLHLLICPLGARWCAPATPELHSYLFYNLISHARFSFPAACFLLPPGAPNNFLRWLTVRVPPGIEFRSSVQRARVANVLPPIPFSRMYSIGFSFPASCSADLLCLLFGVAGAWCCSCYCKVLICPLFVVPELVKICAGRSRSILELPD